MMCPPPPRRRRSGDDVPPWMEEGEVPAWSDGVGGTETVVDHNMLGERQDEMSTPKTTCRKFKLHEIEKDLNESISLSVNL